MLPWSTRTTPRATALARKKAMSRSRTRDAGLLFWASGALLGYVYAGYPLLIRAWAAIRPRPAPDPGRQRAPSPAVTVLVVAHDEAPRIAARIDNLLALDYRHDEIELVVASDGSTDGTAAIARAYEPRGVSVVAFETRRGKAAVLNDLVPKARGDIVILADARQRFATNAIRALVAPFADPEVGAV